MFTSGLARVVGRASLLVVMGIAAAAISEAAPQRPERSQARSEWQAQVNPRSVDTVRPADTFPALLAQLETVRLLEQTPRARVTDSGSLSFSPGSVSVSARQDESPMGFQLPEPGPVSAIIATIALTAFFFVRRA